MPRIEKYYPRNISNVKMRKEIIDYLKNRPKTDAYDVAISLTLDPGRVIDMCHRLVQHGQLEYITSHNR